MYRDARGALIALDPNSKIDSWRSRFLELKDTDIRGPGREDDEPSGGHILSSWIWYVGNAPKPDERSHPNGDAEPNAEKNLDLPRRAASGEEVAISIRSHWARCQARAERHKEEVELTLEEMRRTLQFFSWKSQWWLSLRDARASSPTPPEPQLEHRIRAYAHCQASIYSSLVTVYVDYWREFLLQHSLGTEWLSLYPTTPPSPTGAISEEGLDEPLESNANDEYGDDDDDDEELNINNLVDPEFEERFADLPGS